LYIGRVNLKGFKSFGGSHEISLSKKFTAVVGPNGSGKSNILDALRWVLGDSHPGRLRIVRQGDLLFQGSISMPPATSSEVLVHLVDGDRVCALKRRYSGEEGSTILVDGKRMRLSDLEPVKREWRLEGDRFAFISQGEVSEMIQQRPLQRRTHLECIFGIDLYRRQREEATQRLDTATSEMNRLLTLRSELQTRRETIADAVVRAREARGIMDLLERERSRLYWIRRARGEALLEASRSEVTELEARKTFSVFWSSGWRRALAAEGGRIQKLSLDRKDAKDRLVLLEAESAESGKEMFSVGTTLRGAIERRKEAERDIGDERDRLAQTGSRLEKAAEDLAGAMEEEKKTSGELLEEKKKWESYQKSLEDHSERIRDFREKEASLKGSLEGERARGKALGRSLVDVSEACSANQESEIRIRESVRENESRLSEARAQEEDAGRSHRDAYAAFQQAAARKQALSRDLAGVERDIESIKETVFSRVYPQPVQHLQAAARLGRLEASPRPLVDVISCPENLSVAIEAYLGARQFLLLVRDIDEAGRCIDHLKSRNAGRATFLPLEKARRRLPDKSFSTPGKGVVGWASDLVKMEKEWEDCVLHVLGDLLVTETFEAARDISRRGFRGPIVTIEGDVFLPGGTISGGKSSRGPGAIEMKRRIAEKESAAADVREEIQGIERDLAGLEAEEARAAGRVRSLAEDRKSLEEESRILAGELDSSLREVEHARERVEKIKDGLGDCGRRQVKILEELAAIRAGSGEDFDTSREVDMVRLLEEKRSRADLARERLAAAGRVHSMILEEKGRSVDRIALLEKGLGESSATAETALSGLSRMGKKYFSLWKEKEQAEARLELLEKRYSAALSVQNRVMERSAGAAGRLESMEGRIRQAHQRIEAAEAEISESADMWEDRFPYPGNGNVDTMDHYRVRRSVRDLEKRLRETGDVDTGVLSEDSSLAERISFLEEQLRDVGTGIEELGKLIEETDRQAGVLFSTSLKEIDRRFCALFQRLFGGGEAHLRLSDEGAVWDAGVEVIARPPGKRPQNLAQLSGGEQSLSAISLLFAAMEVAGVPLAVLDEVDASLDEVNLGRFSELAREYSKNMQLICMTHRRATMERADLMYGVTMSEPGLSQVVGVRLEDWD
jgi:chromosome segregation protein